MRQHLPFQWMECVPGVPFTGTAAPNEYYAFQLGVRSPSTTLEHVRYEASDFTNGSTVLGKERFTCFNTEGVNPDSKPFTKQVQVARGQVQPLWFGLDIPQDTPADDEAVKVTVYQRGKKLLLSVGNSVPTSLAMSSQPWIRSNPLCS